MRISRNQKAMIHYMKKHGSITVSEGKTLLKKKGIYSRRSVYRSLRGLQKHGIVWRYQEEPHSTSPHYYFINKECKTCPKELIL